MADGSGSRGVSVPDLVGGAALVALGVAFAVGSLEYGVLGVGGRVAPGAMPFFSGVLLAVFGLGVIGTALRGGLRIGSAPRDETRHEPGEEPGRAEPPESPEADLERDEQPVPSEASEQPDRPGRALTVLALTTVAAVIGQWIGFLLAFGLLIVLLLVVLERERLWLALLVAVGGTVFAYLLFIEFLGVPLPEGPLF